MQEHITLTGMILKQSPVGEYDRVITLLTIERGKITAFARGARRPGNKMAGVTNPLSFGRFKVYEGKNSYTVAEANIENYFEALRTDIAAACYGMYFAEVTDYYTRENNDEKEMLKLLYQSLRALSVKSLSHELVQCIFECKALAVNGEYPGPPTDRGLNPSTIYTLEYIGNSPIESLYTFTVSDEVLAQLKQISREYMNRYVGHTFKSLEVLQTLC